MSTALHLVVVPGAFDGAHGVDAVLFRDVRRRLGRDELLEIVFHAFVVSAVTFSTRWMMPAFWISTMTLFWSNLLRKYAASPTIADVKSATDRPCRSMMMICTLFSSTTS